MSSRLIANGGLLVDWIVTCGLAIFLSCMTAEKKKTVRVSVVIS